jgi:hypothetical protein
MTNRKDGGAAFPQPCTSNGYQANSPFEVAGGGMTLRDYFAAKAIQAIIIGNGADECAMGIGAARDAYIVADAMLSAREAK